MNAWKRKSLTEYVIIRFAHYIIREIGRSAVLRRRSRNVNDFRMESYKRTNVCARHSSNVNAEGQNYLNKYWTLFENRVYLSKHVFEYSSSYYDNLYKSVLSIKRWIEYVTKVTGSKVIGSK